MISCDIYPPYNPGTNQVKSRHINSDTGTKYFSDMAPKELVSEKLSIMINVKVIKMAIIVIAKMTANTSA